MPELFGLDIAGIINDALGNQLLPGTLTKAVRTRNREDLSAGWTTETTRYGCRGFIVSKTDTRDDDSLPSSTGNSVLILGASLPIGVVPAVNDLIEFEGEEFVISGIKRDPAAATYECLVDGRG